MAATELEDLEVDRVDGVDDPATKRRFLLAKSEDVDELRVTLRAVEKRTVSVLKCLAKSEEGYDADTLAELKKLAKLCDLQLDFKERKAKESPPPAAPPKAADEGKGGDSAALVAAITDGLSKGFGDLKKSLDGVNAKLEELAKEDDDEEEYEDEEKAEGDEPEEEEDEEEMSARKSRERTSKSRLKPQARLSVRRVTSSQARDDEDDGRVAKGATPKFGKGMFDSVFRR